MIWPNVSNSYFAADSLAGMAALFPDRYSVLFPEKNSASLIHKDLLPSKVRIIISGGAGNGPLFSGFVGPGLADACVCGAPFAAPNAYSIYETASALDHEHGVLLLSNQFAGDLLNNDMAADLLAMDHIQVRTFFCNDDIATAVNNDRRERNGRAGIAILIKLAGCMSEKAYSLSEIYDELALASERLGTISLTWDSLNEKFMIGSGFSGEPGLLELPENTTREEACNVALSYLLKDLSPRADEKIFFLINRLRLTSYADSFIMSNHCKRLLDDHFSDNVIRIGSYSNISDQFGYTFSMLCMNKFWASLLSKPLSSHSFTI